MAELFDAHPSLLVSFVPRWVWLAYAALIGLCLGSFCNVLVHRLPRGQSLWPRSVCPGCATPIRWYDNVPLLSFTILRGRCRRCARWIGWRYPAVEASVALLWVGAILRYGATTEGLGVAGFATCLVPGALIDLETLTIPDSLNLMVLLNGVGAAFSALTPVTPRSAVMAAVAGAVLFGAIVVVTRGMGTADILLAAGLGANLGLDGLVIAVWCAAVLGGLVALSLCATGVRRFGEPMPYGPVLSAGALIAAYGGPSTLLAAAGLGPWS